MTFEERVREYGTTSCACCGEEFSLDKPCCCDNGNLSVLEDGICVTLHIDGRCVMCCEGNKMRRMRNELV